MKVEKWKSEAVRSTKAVEKWKSEAVRSTKAVSKLTQTWAKKMKLLKKEVEETLKEKNVLEEELAGLESAMRASEHEHDAAEEKAAAEILAAKRLHEVELGRTQLELDTERSIRAELENTAGWSPVDPSSLSNNGNSFHGMASPISIGRSSFNSAGSSPKEAARWQERGGMHLSGGGGSSNGGSRHTTPRSSGQSRSSMSGSYANLGSVQVKPETARQAEGMTAVEVSSYSDQLLREIEEEVSGSPNVRDNKQGGGGSVQGVMTPTSQARERASTIGRRIGSMQIMLDLDPDSLQVHSPRTARSNSRMGISLVESPRNSVKAPRGPLGGGAQVDRDRDLLKKTNSSELLRPARAAYNVDAEGVDEVDEESLSEDSLALKLLAVEELRQEPTVTGTSLLRTSMKDII